MSANELTYSQLIAHNQHKVDRDIALNKSRKPNKGGAKYGGMDVAPRANKVRYGGKDDDYQDLVNAGHDVVRELNVTAFSHGSILPQQSKALEVDLFDLPIKVVLKRHNVEAEYDFVSHPSRRVLAFDDGMETGLDEWEHLSDYDEVEVKQAVVQVKPQTVKLPLVSYAAVASALRTGNDDSVERGFGFVQHL